VESQLFEQYLTNYADKAFQYASNPGILKNDSLVLNVLTPRLVILPGSFATTLGLKEQKYPDIVLFVLREDEGFYHCSIENTNFLIPKGWIKNGT
jgi:hypothetical protein